MRYYEDYVNPLSYALFYWINWLLRIGYDHPLEMNELGSLPVNHSVKYNYQKLRRIFKKELVRNWVPNNSDKALGPVRPLLFFCCWNP